MNIAVWATVLLLALSSSIDNFGGGITYGIRDIRIGFLANFIISTIALIFSEVGTLMMIKGSTFIPFKNS
jgi:putative Mn2+ efflux pump MntP